MLLIASLLAFLFPLFLFDASCSQSMTLRDLTVNSHIVFIPVSVDVDVFAAEKLLSIIIVKLPFYCRYYASLNLLLRRAILYGYTVRAFRDHAHR